MRLRNLYTAEELANQTFVHVSSLLIEEIKERLEFLPYRFEFYLGANTVIPISFLMQSLDTMHSCPVAIDLLELVQNIVARAPYNLVEGLIEDFLCLETTRDSDYWHILSKEELQSLLDEEDDEDENYSDSLYLGLN